MCQTSEKEISIRNTLNARLQPNLYGLGINHELGTSDGTVLSQGICRSKAKSKPAGLVRRKPAVVQRLVTRFDCMVRGRCLITISSSFSM